MSSTVKIERSTPWFVRLPRNHIGRDFCVGDLHGMFTLLRTALSKLQFDPNIDRLLCVGDMIDRGPESEQVADLVSQPWFHAVRGNHEQMLLDSATDPALEADWTYDCGGEWWLNVSIAEREKIHRLLDLLPYALEVETNQGQVGVIHADIPKSITWGQFVLRLINGDQEVREHVLWSRIRVGALKRGTTVRQVPGIDLLVCGHTPISKATKSGNVYFIDTGAVYRKNRNETSLTLLEIQPVWQVHSFGSNLPG